MHHCCSLCYQIHCGKGCVQVDKSREKQSFILNLTNVCCLHFIDMLQGISAETEFNNISVFDAGSFTPCHVQYCSFRSSECQKQINSKLNLYTLVYWFTNKSLLLNPELTSLPKVKENNLRWRRQRILKVKVPMATLTWTTCHKN